MPFHKSDRQSCGYWFSRKRGTCKLWEVVHSLMVYISWDSLICDHAWNGFGMIRHGHETGAQQTSERPQKFESLYGWCPIVRQTISKSCRGFQQSFSSFSLTAVQVLVNHVAKVGLCLPNCSETPKGGTICARKRLLIYLESLYVSSRCPWLDWSMHRRCRVYNISQFVPTLHTSKAWVLGDGIYSNWLHKSVAHVSLLIDPTCRTGQPMSLKISKISQSQSSEGRTIQINILAVCVQIFQIVLHALFLNSAIKMVEIWAMMRLWWDV